MKPKPRGSLPGPSFQGGPRISHHHPMRVSVPSHRNQPFAACQELIWLLCRNRQANQPHCRCNWRGLRGYGAGDSRPRFEDLLQVNQSHHTHHRLPSPTAAPVKLVSIISLLLPRSFRPYTIGVVNRCKSEQRQHSEYSHSALQSTTTGSTPITTAPHTQRFPTS